MHQRLHVHYVSHVIFPQSAAVLHMTGICGLAGKPTSNSLYTTQSTHIIESYPFMN